MTKIVNSSHELLTNAPHIVRFSGLLRFAIYACCFSVALWGCTGLSRLTESQYLVTKNKLILTEKSEIPDYKQVKEELQNEIFPKPNRKLLWMRPRLALHNTIAETEKKKGFKYWLKYKVGKPPALLDEEICQKLNQTFENRLYHNGHFRSKSEFKILKKTKTAQVIFHIEAKKAYLIDTLILPESTNALSRAIIELNENSLVQKNASYSLELLKKERDRIDLGLKNRGYYYFDPDFLLFLADTTRDTYRIRLKLVLKNETPTKALRSYTVGRISVAEDFKLQNYDPDTIQLNNYSIISASSFMRPKVYLNSILLDKGAIYSKEKHNNSVRQLMGLRSYKFVNARFMTSSGSRDNLEVTYQMTPMQKMSLSAEIHMVSKSNNFAGPGLKLSYKSRNFLRGAELFSVNLNGRFEQQISGEGQGDTAYEISADANLEVPRLVPFTKKKRNKPYLPNANFMIGSGLFARVSLYKFNTFTTGLEYSWRKNEYLTHIFRPVDISVTNLFEVTEQFEEFLALNPSIRRSFEEQFIVGSAYNFILNRLSADEGPQFYLNTGIDPSGNLLSMLHRLTTGKKETPDDNLKIFGAPLSQYFRIRTDFRYYFKTGKESRIATRFYTGIGIPYGNSEVMPYVKQFYAGGTNSMRAFRARSLGPGSYLPPDSLRNVLVDQTGEIKLEANIEYRFPIAGYLKGALFTDIGNIWLVNEDPIRPGSKFEIGEFHKELAVGLGFGLRIDVDLVVLRFDWAFPVRKPWLPEHDRWVFDEIDLLDSRWRRNNLLWNISIGYPF